MKTAILIIALIGSLTWQVSAQMTVAGRVVDQSRESIPGVNIMIKGTTVGTTTNLDGDYIISGISSTDILVFSYVGMETQEIAVGEQTIINITMAEAIQNLDEVVVVGYGGVKRANLLGSVADISSEDIVDLPAENLSTLLEGRLAGVRIGQSSGKPGANTGIMIRTSTSWNGETPIFVIDGTVYEDQARFDMLDPSEIESISVLKDASAAVYGARAAGGVILVQTRKGKMGKPKITYAGSYGISGATTFPEMLSAHDQAVFINDALKIIYPDTYERQSDYYTEDELEHFRSLDYNWLEEAWKSSYLTRHTLNISGGSDRFRYFGGGTYYYETGNFDNLYAQKYTLRMGVDADIIDNLTISFTLSADNRKDERPYNRSDIESDPLRGTFQALLQTPRWIPPYINGLPVGQRGLVTSHPLEIEKINSYARNRGTNYNMNTSFEYRIPFVNGLKLRASFSFNEGNSYGKQLRVPYYLYDFVTTGGHRHILTDEVFGEPTMIENGDEIQESYSLDRSYQFNGSVSYARKFGNHDVNALFVYEQSENEGNSFSAQRENLVVATYERQEGFSEALDGTRSGASAGGRLSYIGRINYNFKEKYLVETAFRYEGSVKFPPETRWGFFPSVALGWRISEEPFFKDNISWIDYLKIRASAGLLGNDKVGSRQWEYSYSTTGGAYLGGTALTNAVEPRNNSIILQGVTWEKSQSYNAGFDMRFVNNISFGFDVFYRYTYDILSERKSTLPTSTGIDRMPKENHGRMDGWGGEIEAGYDVRVLNDLNLHFGGNLSFARSRVLEKFQNPAVIGTWKDEIGKMPNGEVGYFATGIIRTQEEADELKAMGWTIFGKDPEPGMLNYKDMGSANYSDSLDGIIDGNDERILEPYASAPYSYGFNIGVSWKSVSMNANFSGGFGHNVFFEKEAFILPDEVDDLYKLRQNMPTFWKDHWTEENPDAEYPRAFNNGATQRSTFWMRNGHVLRLSSLNIVYKLPKSISTRIHIPTLQVVLSARNLWTIINPYDFKDPAISKFNGYPLIRSLNLGINITL